jgi:hypothetical protein
MSEREKSSERRERKKATRERESGNVKIRVIKP